MRTEWLFAKIKAIINLNTTSKYTYVGGWIGGQMDGWVGRWMNDGWIDEQRQIKRCPVKD